MKASIRPARVVVNDAATGKSLDPVVPVTYALPVESTAMAFPKSLLAPPRNEEYESAVAAPLSLATNASVTRSEPPPNAVWNVLTAGKFGELVSPVTYR